MAFPGLGYKSPRKKEDLKPDKPIIYISKKEKIFYEDIAKAINKYYLNGTGTIFIDDLFLSKRDNGRGWHKLSLYFKAVK